MLRNRGKLCITSTHIIPTRLIWDDDRVKKRKHLLKVLRDILTRADISFLIHFDEVWGCIQSSEQLSDYPLLDREEWTEDNFKDMGFIECYRKFLIDHVERVTEADPNLLMEMLEDTRSATSKEERLWRVLMYDENNQTVYRCTMSVGSRNDAWFYIATILIPANPRARRVELSEIET